ncbi:MAG: ABC transporter permease [Synechococcales bacterium]|nr:ABC transporter permease [Synechococcales bacterium]
MFGFFKRTQVVAANVFREVIRDRVLYLVLFYGAIMGLAAWLLPEISAATENKILPDVGLAAMQVLGVLLAIFVGTGLVNKEIEKRTVFVLIAKPVSRVEFILGKHLGLTAVLGVLVIAMVGIYAIALQAKQVAFVGQDLLLHAGLLWLQLSLVTAIAIGFGVFTSSLLATLMTFGVYLMGILSNDLVTLGRASKNPTVEQVTRYLYYVLPDLSKLDLKNQLVYNLIPPIETILTNVGYGLLYIVLVLTTASFIFSRREF